MSFPIIPSVTIPTPVIHSADVSTTNSNDKVIHVCDFSKLPTNGVINVRIVGRGDYDSDEKIQGVWDLTVRRRGSTDNLQISLVNLVYPVGGEERRLSKVYVAEATPMPSDGHSGRIVIEQESAGHFGYLLTATASSGTVLDMKGDAYTDIGNQAGQINGGSGNGLFAESRTTQSSTTLHSFDDTGSSEYIKVFNFYNLQENGLIELSILGRGDYDTDEKTQGVWKVLIRRRDVQNNIYVDPIIISDVTDGDARKPIEVLVRHGTNSRDGEVWVRSSSADYISYMFKINTDPHTSVWYLGENTNTAPTAGANQTLVTEAFHNPNLPALSNEQLWSGTLQQGGTLTLSRNPASGKTLEFILNSAGRANLSAGVTVVSRVSVDALPTNGQVAISYIEGGNNDNDRIECVVRRTGDNTFSIPRLLQQAFPNVRFVQIREVP